MPLDGLSFSSSAFFRPITPAEVALQVEKIAQNQAETVIKKTEEGEKIKSDSENDEDESSKNSEGRNTEDESEDDNSNIFLSQEKIKKYKVKFNSLTDMVELIDQKTGSVIETISPNDLMNLLSKSAKPSGILVDREI